MYSPIATTKTRRSGGARSGSSAGCKNWRKCGCPASNPGHDGALNKPVFNSSGSPYIDAQSPANFFKRSGGGFRAGKAPTRRLPPGAVHTSDSKSPKRTSEPGANFRAGVTGQDVFSRPSILDPNHPKKSIRKGGGGFKAGKVQRNKVAPAPTLGPEKPAPLKRPPPEHPWKAGGPARDFFDPSMHAREPVHDPLGRKPDGRKWVPAGKRPGTINKFPTHMPDPYVEPASNARKGPGMYVCVSWSRTCPPIEWDGTRAAYMYANRVGGSGTTVYNVMKSEDAKALTRSGRDVKLGREFAGNSSIAKSLGVTG